MINHKIGSKFMRKIFGVVFVVALATASYSQTNNSQNEQWSGIAFQEPSYHADKSVVVWKLNYPSMPALEVALLKECND
jgi:hypothetical protein